MDTTNINAEQAKALLDRDQLNRVKRLAEKGGVLGESDRKQLRLIVNRAAKKRAYTHTKKDDDKDGKHTEQPSEREYAQRQRRRKVYVMRLRGDHSIRDIAAELGVDKMTIMRDLKAIDATLHEQIDPAMAMPIINEAVADMEAVRLLAMEAIADTEGQSLAALLNTITKASEVKIALLQDAGTLPKAGRKLEVSGPDGQPLAGAAQPIVHIVFEQTEETRALEKQYNVLPD